MWQRRQRGPQREVTMVSEIVSVGSIEEDHTCSSLFSKLLQSNSGAQGRKMDLQGSWCDSVVTTLLKLIKKAYLSNFCFKWYKV